MSRRTRLVLAPLAVAVAGVVVAAVVIGVVLLMVRVFPPDPAGWRDLGLIVVGMFVAVAVGVVVWVAGLAWAARRVFEPGRRLGVVIATVTVVFVLVVVAALAAGRTLEVPVIWFVVPVVLVVPSVVFPLWDRRRAVSP